eukprot:5696599-Alexandrium_andersonii.AAC.1
MVGESSASSAGGRCHSAPSPVCGGRPAAVAVRAGLPAALVVSIGSTGPICERAPAPGRLGT